MPERGKEMFGEVPIPRHVRIHKSDLKAHGFTARCEGCRAALTGRPSRPHSEECRKRLEQLMKDDPKTKAQQARVDDFERVAQEEDKKDVEAEQREGRRGGEWQWPGRGGAEAYIGS